MALAEDIADDWKFFDGVEDVTFTPKTPTSTAINSVKALIGQVPRTMLQFGANFGVSPTDIGVSMWASTLPGVTDINPGDEITRGDGRQYVVITANLQTLDTRWVCVCRKKAE